MEDNPDSTSSIHYSISRALSKSSSISSERRPDSQTDGCEVPSGSQKFSERKISNLSLSEGSMTRTRRSRLQKQLELQGAAEAQEKGSLTPAMRKKYLQELFLNHKSHTGLSSILSIKSASLWSRDGEDAGVYSLEDPGSGAFWALDPLEHAWMLSVVDGNYDTMVDFLTEDPSLLTRKDFVSGYTALHWLAKNGKHETLIRLLRRAEKEGSPVNVNLKGSGGQTALHVAAMHNQYMVVKILVGAFGANIDAMDYSGKRAWQYLRDSAPPEMKELLGAWDEEHRYWQLNVNNNCAGSEVYTAQESPKDTDEVDSFNRRTGRWPFGSFRKLLSPFFSGGKK
ncbi:ankyrin repeat domain-containing protein SOWAHC [Salminus brasiliensis]|uniref:ankyrin repeat domain-containing protein SOWAHC n=1 Tax=Salminus brasiliensis TaxID=930266 RepID=UPI003B839E1A